MSKQPKATIARVRKAFLAGVLAGTLATIGVVTVVQAYSRVNTRLSFIEGYLGQLDRVLRGGR